MVAHVIDLLRAKFRFRFPQTRLSVPVATELTWLKQFLIRTEIFNISRVSKSDEISITRSIFWILDVIKLHDLWFFVVEISDPYFSSFTITQFCHLPIPVLSFKGKLNDECLNSCVIFQIFRTLQSLLISNWSILDYVGFFFCSYFSWSLGYVTGEVIFRIFCVRKCVRGHIEVLRYNSYRCLLSIKQRSTVPPLLQ